MKNFTKQITNKALFKPTRWLLIAFMFLLGTGGAWGATVTFTSDDVLFFNMNAVSWWTAGTNGNGNFAYFYNNSTNKNAWSAHAVQYSGDVYYVKIPAGTWEGVILTRNNTSTAPTWDNKWNQTGDISLSSTSNYISKFSENSTSATWSTQKPTSTGKLTASSASVNTNTSVTLTPSLTSYTTYNEIKSTTYAISPSTGASISGNTFTATAAGTYTVTATITYNPRGYSSLTSTVSPTVTITVTKSCETVAKEQYSMSATTFTYNGSKQVPTISPVDGAGAVTSTVYKLNNTTTVANPTDAGTYTVYVTSSDGTTYCGASSLNIGTFTINKKTVAKEQYPMSPVTFTYNGSKQVPTINPATGAGTVTSIVYKLNNTTTVANPTDAGTYTVYVTSSAGTNYTAASSLNIGTFTINKETVATGQYPMSPTTFTYNGSKQVPTINPVTGAGAVTSTVYKLNNTTTVANPTDAGTYTVYVTSSAGTNYTAASSLNIGTFTINKKTVAKEQYSMSPTIFSYNGSKQVPTITPAAGAGAVTSTVYKLNNTTTVANPTDAGTYTVYVTSSAGTNYTAASNLNIGTFTINEVCEPISGLSWSITSGEKATYCPGDEVTVTMTYNGTTAKDYDWGGDYKGNIGILGGSIASGAQYTMTINKSGSVNLTLTGCNGATPKTSTLTFEVVEAPVKPTITFSANPVGQNKPTTLTVGEYNGTLNNYTLYKDGVSQGAYTAPQEITIGEVGEYEYYVVATSKACPSLTATSETVPLEVHEAGAKIVQLGDLVLYTNDNTDFVPMYVQKDGIVDIAGATKVTGYTWEYSANGTSDWAACSTGYLANGVGMDNGGEKCNNWRANAVGYYRCKITYDNGSQYSNSLHVTQGTNNKTNKQHINDQRNLPIISVNTGANSFPSDNNLSGYPSAHADDLKAKISVDVKIFNADGTLHYDRKARMNYRGSSSLNFKKKSYAFVTGKEKTKNDKGDVDTGKANLFGLSDGAEDKDWVLYASTPDPSMMRNRLVFDLYQQMRQGEWGVNSKYVELVINGEYMGVYVLMDKITENEKRINITASDGFIVKFDKTDIADRYVDGKQSESDEKTFKTERTGRKGISTYGTNVDQLFEIEYPEKEDTEDAGGNWTSVVETIKDRFEKFETALANKDYTAVRTLIDYDSWADWFILTEFIKNQDGFRASCIFVYNGGKIEARPLWDQELSFDNRTRMAHGSNSAEDLMIKSDGVYSDCFPAPFWFYGKNATFGTCGNNNGSSGSGTRYSGYLLADPCFVSLVKSKWATYQTGILSAGNISGMVSDYATELGNAQTREQSRWAYDEGTRGTTNNGLYIGYYAGEGDSNYFGYSASKGSITTWATNRSTPLGENTNGLGEALYNLEGDALIFTINPSTIETSPWQQNVITVNAPTGYEYEINFSELTNVGTEVKENGDSYTFKVPRPNGWGTAGNGTAQSVQYTISATIDAEGENACGTQISNTATSVVTLKDVTENCSPEVKP